MCACVLVSPIASSRSLALSKEERRLHLSRGAESNKASEIKISSIIKDLVGRVKGDGALFNRVGENEKPAVQPESSSVIAADKKCQRNTTVPRKLTATMTRGWCAQPLFYRFVWLSLDLPRVFPPTRANVALRDAAATRSSRKKRKKGKLESPESAKDPSEAGTPKNSHARWNSR